MPSKARYRSSQEEFSQTGGGSFTVQTPRPDRDSAFIDLRVDVQVLDGLSEEIALAHLGLVVDCAIHYDLKKDRHS